MSTFAGCMDMVSFLLLLMDCFMIVQAAVSSMISFTGGGAVPLLAAIFVRDPLWRMISVSIAATFALASFGVISAWLGGAKRIRASVRVLFGGWIAMAVTFGVGRLFGQMPA